MTRALLLAALPLYAGCAGPLAGACADSLFEVAGRFCCESVSQSICRDDGWDDDSSEPTDEPERARQQAAQRMREAPAPTWHAQPGRIACSVTRELYDVTVSCADGTRALLLADVTDALVTEEPTTSTDPCKGTARKQGVDRDGDGALSALELIGRTVLCDNELEVPSPTLWGDLAILSADDVVLAAGRRAITGGVTLSGHALVSLSLPSLRSVGGSLRVARAPMLQEVAVEQLTTVGDDLVVTGLPRLTQLSLPALRALSGVTVTDNALYPEAELERLVAQLSRRGFSGPVLSGGNAR